MDKPCSRCRQPPAPVTAITDRCPFATVARPQRTTPIIAGLLAIIGSSIAAPAWATEAQPGAGVEAKKLFNQRCTACHTFGKGVKVGPDLKGVTERRPRRWLLSFIRGSQKMIKSGDPVAAGLFRQFKQERMPDWSDLTPEQVGGILDWFAINGPEQRSPDERDAELATAAEVAQGRQLFHGAIAQASHGLACAACHAIRDGGTSSSAGLASDLTTAYLAYRDRALTLFLKTSCFLREPERASQAYLMPGESFLIKAYLRHTALAAQTGAQLATQAPGTVHP
jgi:mono/diheme cytochrome c family protein